MNQLVNRSVNYAGPSSAIDELTENAELLRADANGDDGSPWRRLIMEFSLSPIEQDILLLAVAPELDLKYETLFGYLNNDVTRKWPTFGLALRTSTAVTESSADVRRCLLPEAKLFSSGLLQPIGLANDPALWLYGFCGGTAGLQYLADAPALDPRLASFVEQSTVSIDWQRLSIPAELRNALYRFARRWVDSQSTWPMNHLSGRQGVGRSVAAGPCAGNSACLRCCRVDLEGLRACW